MGPYKGSPKYTKYVQCRADRKYQHILMPTKNEVNRDRSSPPTCTKPRFSDKINREASFSSQLSTDLDGNWNIVFL